MAHTAPFWNIIRGEAGETKSCKYLRLGWVAPAASLPRDVWGAMMLERPKTVLLYVEEIDEDELWSNPARQALSRINPTPMR